jgi:hypothetical protein
MPLQPSSFRKLQNYRLRSAKPLALQFVPQNTPFRQSSLIKKRGVAVPAASDRKVRFPKPKRNLGFAQFPPPQTTPPSLPTAEMVMSQRFRCLCHTHNPPTQTPVTNFKLYFLNPRNHLQPPSSKTQKSTPDSRG